MDDELITYAEAAALLGVSADELITYAQAAALSGVSVDCLRTWKYRGKLEPATYTSRGPLFDLADVLAAKEHVQSVRHRRVQHRLAGPQASREDGYLGYAEAAALVRVPEETVRQWKSRRYIHPIGWDGRAPLFRAVDVLAADAKVRAVPQGRKRKNAA